jgi:hypothetical protein
VMRHSRNGETYKLKHYARHSNQNLAGTARSIRSVATTWTAPLP